MKLLLDTHVLIWWLGSDLSLSPTVWNMIREETNQKYVSAVSIWEIRLKQSLGKLQGVIDNFYETLMEYDYIILPITAEHANAIGDLPLIHRDPFDRMLIVQARMEGLTLVTRDKNIMKYDISILIA